MAEFGASVLLSAEVDPQSLREARATVEDELDGAATVGVGSPGAGAPAADGGFAGEDLTSLAAEQRDLLDDILDELQQGVGGGGGGGGLLALGGGDGGGGGGGAGAGLLGGLAGGQAAGRLGSVGRFGGLAAGLAAQIGLSTAAQQRASEAPGATGDVLGAFATASPVAGAPIAAVNALAAEQAGGLFDGLLSDLGGGGPTETGGPGPRGPAGPTGTGTGTGGSLIDSVVTAIDRFTGRATGGSTGSVTRTRRGDPLAGTGDSGGGDTTINITPEIALEQEGLSVREAERKIEAGMDEAKQEAVSEVERRLNSPIPRRP